MPFGTYNLETFLKYFFIFSVFGANPFGYKSKEIYFSWISFLVNVAISVCILIFALFVIQTEYNRYLYISSPIRILYVGMIISHEILSISFLTIPVSWRKKNYSAIIMYLFNLESYTKSTVSVNKLILIFSLQLFFEVSLLIGSPDKSSTFYSIIYIQTIIVLLQFSCFLLAIETQLESLTKILENLSPKSNKIVSILENHDIILKCSSALNCLYSPQLLLYFINSFFVTVSLIHYVAVLILNDDTHYTPSLLWIPSSMSLFYILDKQFLLVLQNHAKKRGLYDPHQTLINIHLSNRQPIKINVCGFFDIDNSLLLSVGSSVTTYTMILTQLNPKPII